MHHATVCPCIGCGRRGDCRWGVKPTEYRTTLAAIQAKAVAAKKEDLAVTSWRIYSGEKVCGTALITTNARERWGSLGQSNISRAHPADDVFVDGRVIRDGQT